MLRKSPPPALPHRLAAALLLLAAACSDGGAKSVPAGEVLLASNHHVYLLSSVAAFSAFPVQPIETLPLSGTLLLNADGTYDIVLGANTSGTDTYAIGSDAAFSLFVDRGPRRPKVRYAGAYGLEGDTGLFFAADRFTGSATGGIGLFLGARVAAAAPTLEGSWHAFSLHVILAPPGASLESRNVGRAVGGNITVDAAGAVTGAGTESSLAAITWTGTAQALGGDGRVSLQLDYADPVTSDPRRFNGAAGPGVIFALDDDATTGETGVLALLAHRTGSADPALLAGDYHLGLQSVFVDPARPGTDAAAGTLTFDATGSFTISAIGAQSVAFGFSGTYSLADDGALTLTAGNEAWVGAVDQDYRTVVLLDAFVETPTGGDPPALNLFVGLRVPASTP